MVNDTVMGGRSDSEVLTSQARMVTTCHEWGNGEFERLGMRIIVVNDG